MAGVLASIHIIVEFITYPAVLGFVDITRASPARGVTRGPYNDGASGIPFVHHEVRVAESLPRRGPPSSEVSELLTPKVSVAASV